MTIRIAINGLGRIGRSIIRLLATEKGDGFELVALNDIAAPDLVAYLLKYDTVYGPYPGEVSSVDGALILNGQHISLTQESDISGLDLRGVDLLLECTGKADTRDWAERGLTAGARKVLISGPSPEADLTLVLGANDAELTDQTIVSNASCTTNALAPTLKLLDDHYGLISGHMTTIHCYTGSQPTVDAPRGDMVRSRAAALSMIPTTTSAATLADLVLPDLAQKVTSHSVRVPTASVSAVDLIVQLATCPETDAANAVLRSAPAPVFAHTDDRVVSSDLRAHPASIIFATPETARVGADMLRVFGWYDNECGFSNRMLDVSRLMA